MAKATIGINPGSTSDTNALTDGAGQLTPNVALQLNNGSDEPADIDIGQQVKANSVPVVIASDQDSLPVSLSTLPDVDINDISKGTQTNDIKVTLDSEVVGVENTSGKTIKRAVISASTLGDNTLVTAVPSNKIKVLSVLLVAAGDVNVRFEDGAGGTALTGAMTLTSSSGFILNAPTNPENHWFETSVNTLLNLELSAAIQVSGCITYYEEA